MRYLIVQYYKRPSSKLDEVVSVVQRIRPRDLQCAAVILDFQTQSVVKCSMDGVVVPKDWQRIRDFYHEHYSRVIADLDQRHLEIVSDE